MAAAPPAPLPNSADAAIETFGISKRYGQRDAVSHLSIHVPRGSIAGFVGPNGAGKTTTLRMLLGLIQPTAGSATVLGHPITEPRTYLPRVGSLIEGPAFYPGLTGRANLILLAQLGGFHTSRIDDLLENVGLEGRGGDKVKGYSLGMKQRLGIAAALLPSPELLILDEPVNGLDPPGIIEIRDLLRRLRDSGTTVFVSSHLLAEVQQVADWLVVVRDGRSVHCGPTSDLLNRGGARLTLRPEAPDQLPALAAMVRDLGHQAEITGDYLRLADGRHAAAEINRSSMAAGITLVEMRLEQETLEESFLKMIGGVEA